MQYGIEVHTAHRVFLFRATDRAQQLGWIRAIQARIQLASENDLISVAELMISDAEQARARRCVSALPCVPMSDMVSSHWVDRPHAAKYRMQHALETAWAAGREDGDGRGPAVALAMAVQEFRELSRLDLDLVSPEHVRLVCGLLFVREDGGCLFDLSPVTCAPLPPFDRDGRRRSASLTTSYGMGPYSSRRCPRTRCVKWSGNWGSMPSDCRRAGSSLCRSKRQVSRRRSCLGWVLRREKVRCVRIGEEKNGLTQFLFF